VRSPDTPEWQVIHFLDKVGRSTKEQVADYTGMSPAQASTVMRKLKFRKIVAEESSRGP
jgi:hypothetical protein